MSGPKADAILSRAAPKKKKKCKGEATAPTGGPSFIKDDDGGWGWDRAKEEEDDLAEAVVAEDRSFKKRKVAASDTSNWVTVQEGEKPSEDEPIPVDEQPMVVDTEEQPSSKGGLMTAAKLRKMMPTSRMSNTETATAEEIAEAQETVYRDSSGKRIDTKAEKAAAARAKRQREEKEAQKMEWGKGLVQREEEEKRKLELEKQRGKAFARHADDKDLNEEQKSKELWNDPGAAFLTVRLDPTSTGHVLTLSTEKEIQRTSEARVFRSTTTSESFWH